MWHREGEDEADEDDEEDEEEDEAAVASNSESVEISLYEEQHRRNAQLHAAHAQNLSNQRPHSSRSQVIIVDHQDHYGQASFNNAADYHQQVRERETQSTIEYRQVLFIQVHCLSHNMTMPGINKSVIQTDCHINLWFSSI